MNCRHFTDKVPQAEALEREVDAIVYKTYGLTPAEIAEIESWHAERRKQLTTPRSHVRQSTHTYYDEETELELPMTVPTLQDDQLPEKIDVAISYAGPERDFAKALAERVLDAGFVPFYDQFYPQATWGRRSLRALR